MLQFFGSRIEVRIDAARVLLSVRLEDSAYVTRPPEAQDSGVLPEDEAIAPTATIWATRSAGEPTTWIHATRRPPEAASTSSSPPPSRARCVS